MPGPGEYRPDPTEGIDRIEDLPKPKIRIQSRNYRRRPCPHCGHSAYRRGLYRKCPRETFFIPASRGGHFRYNPLRYAVRGFGKVRNGRAR